ncbi:MAG: acyltransferase [Promethearchaeota archaeon]
MRLGIRTTNTLVKKRYLIIYFLVIVLSAQPPLIYFWYLWQLFPPGFNLIFFIAFPFIFMGGVFLFILSSIFIAKIFLLVINFFHGPREGVFARSREDKDYCYWSLRNIVKKWPAWLCRQLNLPFFETLALKCFGVKTSFSNSLHEGWIDSEFIQLGKNVRLGQGSLVTSNLLIQDKLIIKKVIIGDNVIVGIHSIILPGTRIENNTILDTNSMTIVNQHLEENAIYRGIPAEQVAMKEDLFNESKLKSLIFKERDLTELPEGFLTEPPKELSIPFLFYILCGLIIIGGSYILPGFLFVLYFFGLLIPHFLNTPFSPEKLFSLPLLQVMISTPLIFIGLYLLHLFFIALITSWFYEYAEKHGAVQGVFDRNLDESSREIDYYHVRSFLFKYPIFAIAHSPFPWLLNLELKILGSNKVGKGTVFEETYIHSHINFGNNCYLGTFAHMTNHLVDGVYGEENLTFFGINIGDNSVLNALTGGLPGTEMGKNTTLLPMGTTVKYDKLNGNKVYGGFPVKVIEKEELKKFLGGILDEQ